MPKPLQIRDGTYDRLKILRDKEGGSFSDAIDRLLILHGIPDDLKYERVPWGWDEK